MPKEIQPQPPGQQEEETQSLEVPRVLDSDDTAVKILLTNFIPIIKEIAALVGTDFKKYLELEGIQGVKDVIFGTTYLLGVANDIPTQPERAINAAIPIDSLPERGPIAIPDRLEVPQLLEEFDNLIQANQHRLSISSIPVALKTIAFASIPFLSSIESVSSLRADQLDEFSGSPLHIYIFKTERTNGFIQSLSERTNGSRRLTIVNEDSLPYVQITTTVGLWFGNGKTYTDCSFVAGDRTELAVSSLKEGKVIELPIGSQTAKVTPAYIDFELEIPVDETSSRKTKDEEKGLRTIQLQFGYLGEVLLPSERRSIMEAIFRFDTLRTVYEKVLALAIERSVTTAIKLAQASLREMLRHDFDNLTPALVTLAWAIQMRLGLLLSDHPGCREDIISTLATSNKQLLYALARKHPEFIIELLDLFVEMTGGFPDRAGSMDATRISDLVVRIINISTYLNKIAAAEPRLLSTNLSEILDEAMAYAQFLLRHELEENHVNLTLSIDDDIKGSLAHINVTEFAYITISAIINAVKNSQEAAERLDYEDGTLEINITVRRAENLQGIIIEVADNGRGMDQKNLQAIQRHIRSGGISSDVKSLISGKVVEGKHGVGLITIITILYLQAQGDPNAPENIVTVRNDNGFHLQFYLQQTAGEP